MQNSLSLTHFLILSTLLFVIAISGIFINRRNILSILMSIELMLLATNLNFVVFSSFLHDMTGQIFSIFILTVAGAEAAIGLAILVIYFSNRKNIEIDNISTLKG